MSQINVNGWSKIVNEWKQSTLSGEQACRRDVDRSALRAGSVWLCDAADVLLDLTNYWNLLVS